MARAPKRQMSWARVAVEGTATGGTVLSAPLLANFESVYAANLIGATVVRVVGRVGVDSSSSSRHILGCVLDKDTADFTGQGPETARYLDWFVYQPLVTPTAGNDVVSIDSRANRKIGELDQQFWLVLESAQTGTETVVWRGFLSVLLKLA